MVSDNFFIFLKFNVFTFQCACVCVWRGKGGVGGKNAADDKNQSNESILIIVVMKIADIILELNIMIVPFKFIIEWQLEILTCTLPTSHLKFLSKITSP